VHGYAEPDQSGWGLSNVGAGFTYCQSIFEKVTNASEAGSVYLLQFF
jgi:hypothetical protein